MLKITITMKADCGLDELGGWINSTGSIAQPPNMKGYVITVEPEANPKEVKGSINVEKFWGTLVKAVNASVSDSENAEDILTLVKTALDHTRGVEA